MLCPASAHESLPRTVNDVRAFLGTGMCIPVTQQFFTTVQTSDQDVSTRLAATDGSLLPARLSGLLCASPFEVHSEITTTACIISYFQAVFECLLLYSSTKLGFKMFCNKAEATSSSAVTQPRTCPDTHLVVNSCTLLVGEDKGEGHMWDAQRDVLRKMTNLNPLHYGAVPYLLAYIASGSVVQFLMLTGNKVGEEILWWRIRLIGHL